MSESSVNESNKQPIVRLNTDDIIYVQFVWVIMN